MSFVHHQSVVPYLQGPNFISVDDLWLAIRSLLYYLILFPTFFLLHNIFMLISKHQSTQLIYSTYTKVQFYFVLIFYKKVVRAWLILMFQNIRFKFLDFLTVKDVTIVVIFLWHHWSPGQWNKTKLGERVSCVEEFQLLLSYTLVSTLRL
jgi:hypothetical protein